MVRQCLHVYNCHTKNWPCLHRGGGSKGADPFFQNYYKTGAQWQTQKRAGMIAM